MSSRPGAATGWSNKELVMKRTHQVGVRIADWAGLILLVGLAAWPSRASSDPVPGEKKPAEPAKLSGGANENPSDLVVHEWGTFLGMNGSDGTALDGMYHEEHALPGFVHGRARDQLRMPAMFLKGETPVIYFYTPRPMSVQVGVDFPQGVWTHWYPQAVLVRPSLAAQAESPDRLGPGRICWFADLTPPSLAPADVRDHPAKPQVATATLPATSSDALWNFARDVDAAFVKTNDGASVPPRAESERFLFYRGLGRARLPMRAEATGAGTLALESDSRLGEGVRHIFVLRIESGRGAYAYRPILRPGEQATGVIPSMDGSRPLAEFARVIAADLAARLTESGLYPKEARAMVNTWKTSYFQGDGIRVLFVLPQSWTDSFIPIRVYPKPQEIVRVMVGRLELLSPEREHRAEVAVRDLASGDPDRSRQAFAFLRDQGRYVEPIVRRVAATTRDPGVRTLCRRLFLTGFVTDLRAAIHDAVDGKRLDAVPIELRAQLARLYRDMGMAEPARAEATALWQELRRLATGPNPMAEDAAIVRECRGAIYESLRDDRRAAEAYAGRLEQQARSLPPDLNAQAIAPLRDWWVGRAYAQCLGRLGALDSTVVAVSQKLDRPSKNPDNLAEQRAGRILLAFLLEARGERERAEACWTWLETRPALALAPAPK
jgi:hypothetical protein